MDPSHSRWPRSGSALGLAPRGRDHGRAAGDRSPPARARRSRPTDSRRHQPAAATRTPHPRPRTPDRLRSLTSRCTGWIRPTRTSSPVPGQTASRSWSGRSRPVGRSTPPILGDGTLFVGSDDGYLNALDARTGADRWRLDLGASAMPSTQPCSATGSSRWPTRTGSCTASRRRPVRGWHTEPIVNAAAPVLAGGIVYITGTDHRAHGFDLQTGVERWSWTTTADLGNALAIAADVAYVGSHDGVLHAVALAGAQELWSYEMSIPADGRPRSLPAMSSW